MIWTLTRLRLRWYAQATGRVLLRHWQLFIVAGLFVPLGTPVAKLILALGYPLMALLSPGHAWAWYVGYLILVECFALGWILVQRRSIAGGDCMTYVRALPISRGTLRGVDVAVLLLADSLLLVPFVAVSMIAPSSALPGMQHGPQLFLAAWVLLILVLYLQLAMLENKLVRMLPALISASLILGLGLGEGWDTWLLMPAVLLPLLLPMVVGFARPFAVEPSRRRYLAKPAHRERMTWRRMHPAWRTQLQALWLQHPGATSLRLGAALGLALATDALMHVFAFDARALPAAILCMACIAFVLGGMYRNLHAVHEPMRAYLNSLPLPRLFWAMRDTALVVLLGAVPLAMLLAPLMMQQGSKALTVLILVFADCGLIALMRPVFVYGASQTILLGVILAGSWSGIAIAMVI